MKAAFSSAWKASKSPRKQRKYAANAPLHIRQKFMAAPLSKPLREKHKKHSLAVRKGDKVKVLRGQFRNQTGKVDSVLLKRTRVTLDSLFVNKRDGSKSFYPIHPSNVQIIELDLTDKRRIKRKTEEMKK